MSYTVYILHSRKDRKLYVGCTSNLEKRLLMHHKGAVKTTKHRRPLDLIHSENAVDKTSAFKRERFLKSLWGAREKSNILDRYLKNKD